MNERDIWAEVLAGEGCVSMDDIIFPGSRGGGKTAAMNYTRQHSPRYYADDPHDMEMLEEVSSEQLTINSEQLTINSEQLTVNN